MHCNTEPESSQNPGLCPQRLWYGEPGYPGCPSGCILLSLFMFYSLAPMFSNFNYYFFFVVCILKPEAMFLRANQRFNLMRKSLVISLPSDLTGRCWVVTNHGLYFLKWICFPAELTQVSNSCLLQMFFIFIHRSEISYFLSGKLPILTKLLHFPWYQHALSMGDLKIRIKSSWEYILGSSCYENTPTLE